MRSARSCAKAAGSDCLNRAILRPFHAFRRDRACGRVVGGFRENGVGGFLRALWCVLGARGLVHSPLLANGVPWARQFMPLSSPPYGAGMAEWFNPTLGSWRVGVDHWSAMGRIIRSNERIS